MIKYILCVSVLVLLLAILTACGSKAETTTTATNTPVPEPTEIPPLQPGEPNSEPERVLEDSDASIKAYEHRVVSGDNFLNNLYERPFTSEEMEYQPDLNILTVSLVSDDAFFYYTITLDGVDPISGTLTGSYGIEFDRTQTGRGDLLVLVTNPTTEWSMESVVVYGSQDATVGGTKPVVAEEGYDKPGYTSTAALEGDKVAWARIDPGNLAGVQLAISKALLGSEEFAWGAWADGGIQDPSLFDYDDNFGQSEAGSPVKTEDDYPIKAVYSVDNTCRLTYSIVDTSGIPGLCISSQVKDGLHCYCQDTPGAPQERCKIWVCE